MIKIQRPNDFIIKKKLNLNLVKTGYPEVISAMRRLGGSVEFVKEQLKIMGQKVGRYIEEYWNRDFKSLETTIKDLYKLIGRKKLKIIRTQDHFQLIDRNCPLCWKPIEITNIHYCGILTGTVEGFFERYLPKIQTPYKTVKAETVKSRSSGDQFCVHEIDFIKG